MINLIAAVSENGIIGVNGKLPWSCPADMKFFRTKTLESTIIMGRKTYESLGKPLPKRNNVVISRQPVEGVETFTSLEQALEKYNDCWIIGGGQLYREAIAKSMCDTIYLNKIHVMVDFAPGDDVTYFTWIDPTKFMNISVTPDDTKTFTTYSYLRST